MREGAEKVKAEHRERKALLYVRQSTLRQVAENRESTERQYALRQRAVALGWPSERIIVIDEDLGKSGASSDREGFQKLVTEVGLGRVGLVMGLEVSRLARNSADWHRLVQMCALTGALILDEEGIYDPDSFNDRLLLGLKGTMSEFELHLLRSRLRGGMLNKARRGELHTRLPVGLVYDDQGRVALDPDRQVQEALQLFFRTFRRVGTGSGTVRDFHHNGLKFPSQIFSGPRKGEVVWRRLSFGRAIHVLRNPRYAGAYVYGRRTAGKGGLNGRGQVRWQKPEDWHTLIVNAHAGYISWEEHQENLKRLEENCPGRSTRAHPPREGPALVQGIVVCGICYESMTVRYHQRRGRLEPQYECHGPEKEYVGPRCQSISGQGVDDAIGRLLVEVMNPLTLDVSLAVQEEIRVRIEDTDRLRSKEVERVRYDTDLARRRFMQVDPDNRLVADSLEAEWNGKLRALQQTQDEYESQCEADRQLLGAEMQERILALATNFPRLWNDSRTPQRERKRIVRLLVEDVTLCKGEEIKVAVRFKGGITKTLTLPRPLSSYEEWKTADQVVEQIDRLLDDHTYGEICQILNDKGLRSGQGHSFYPNRICRIRKAYRLKGRFDRLRDKGLLTLEETAEKLRVHPESVKRWRRMGLLKTEAVDDSGRHLYDPTNQRPSLRRRHHVAVKTKEVQSEC